MEETPEEPDRMKTAKKILAIGVLFGAIFALYGYMALGYQATVPTGPVIGWRIEEHPDTTRFVVTSIDRPEGWIDIYPKGQDGGPLPLRREIRDEKNMTVYPGDALVIPRPAWSLTGMSIWWREVKILEPFPGAPAPPPEEPTRRI